MRILFTADFDWSPPEKQGRVTLAYKAGWTGSVRRWCGDAAVAAGKAVEVKHGHAEA
jgi:hypothetical protein